MKPMFYTIAIKDGTLHVLLTSKMRPDVIMELLTKGYMIYQSKLDAPNVYTDFEVSHTLSVELLDSDLYLLDSEKKIEFRVDYYMENGLGERKNVGKTLSFPAKMPTQEEFEIQVDKLMFYNPYACLSRASVASTLYSAYKDKGIDVQSFYDVVRGSYNAHYVGD